MFVGLTTSFAFAGWYGLHLVHQPVSHLRSAVKTLASLILLCLVAWLGAPLPIVIGLAFGVMGDFFLSREHESGFLPGLASFLAGHLIYAIWAAVWLRQEGSQASTGYAIAIIGLLVVAGVLWSRLGPVLGHLKLPVAVYVAISVGLGSLAILALSHTSATVFAIGVFAFIASDVILAVSLFLLPEHSRFAKPAATTLWGLYWAGQAALTIGALGMIDPV